MHAPHITIARYTGLLACCCCALIYGCASTDAPNRSDASKVFLELKHQRQDINLCSPTSASMILAYYGEERDPHYLKAIATPPGSTFAGTYMKDMVAGMRKLGYRWEEECFQNDAAGFRLGIRKLKQSVLDHRPVMVGIWHPPIGHVVVLVGVDEAQKKLTFLDPNARAPGLWTATEDTFKESWRENIVNLRCAIFTRPKKA